MKFSTLKMPALILGIGLAACSHDSGFKKASPEVQANTNMQLAIEYMKLGKLASAKDFMETALSQDPGSADVQMTAGIIYERLNEMSKAERAYSTMYRLGKSDPNIQNTYAGFLCRTGKAAAGEKREHHRRRRHRNNEFRKPAEGAPAEATASPAEGAPATEAREGQPQEQRHQRGNRPPRERIEGKDREKGGERDKGGRSFGFTGGHTHANWGDENFRRLVTNAILWSANVEVPPTGAPVDLEPAELKKNLDDKRKK